MNIDQDHGDVDVTEDDLRGDDEDDEEAKGDEESEDDSDVEGDESMEDKEENSVNEVEDREKLTMDSTEVDVGSLDLFESGEKESLNLLNSESISAP